MATVSKRTRKSAVKAVEEVFNPATDEEPTPKKRVPAKKVTSKAKPTAAKKTQKTPVKAKSDDKTKAKKVKKETEAQRERREAKELVEKILMTQEQLHAKYIESAKGEFDGEPSHKDFKWRPRVKKNVWDGKEGMYISPDPCQKFKGYPNDYVTDPVTKIVPMKKLAKSVAGLTPEEDLFKADRRKYIKQVTQALLALDLEKPADKAKYEKASKNIEGLEPVEYFAVAGEPRIICAVSFGPDGTTPADAR